MKDYERFYAKYVKILKETATHWIGECPRCGTNDPTHFYILKTTGQFFCQKCRFSGNHWDLLKLKGFSRKDQVSTLQKYDIIENRHRKNTNFEGLQKKYASTLTPELCEALSVERGISTETLRFFNLGWDGRCYTLPFYDSENKIVGFFRKSPAGKTRLRKGSKASLLNWHILEKEDIIYIFEGPWDLMAAYDRGIIGVSGTNGANFFPQDFSKSFKNKRAFILYDNDATGNGGSIHVSHCLARFTKDIFILDWPADKPTGYDIRDFFNEGNSADDFFNFLYAHVCRPDEFSAKSVASAVNFNTG